MSGRTATGAQIRAAASPIGGGAPLALIGGPCAIEDEKHALMMAERLVRDHRATRRVPFVYKSSYDKANRSSVQLLPRARAPGGAADPPPGASETSAARCSPTSTTCPRSAPAAEVLDVLQIPAFLCRQTDLVVACAQDRAAGERQEGAVPRSAGHGATSSRRSGRRAARRSCSRSGARASATTTWSWTSAACPIMRGLGYPVVFDATHSVQLPGGAGDRSGGERQYVPALARARRGGRRGRALHGDPRGSRPDAARRPAALRRAQHAPARRSAAAAGRDRRDHRRRSGRGVVMDAEAASSPWPSGCCGSRPRHPRALPAARRRASCSAVELLHGCSRTRHRHRHGQVRARRTEDRRHLGEHGHARLLPPSGRGRPRRPRHGGPRRRRAGAVQLRRDRRGAGGAAAIKRLGVPLILLTGTPGSTLARQATSSSTWACARRRAR